MRKGNSDPVVHGASPATGGARDIDDLDLAIIDQLQQDGRRSFRALAGNLDVPEATIRFRTKRLLSQGTLTIVGLANPHRMGFEVLASVLLLVEPGKREAAIASLASWPEVMYLSSGTGKADLYAQIVCRDQEHLRELLGKRLAGVKGIRAVDTMIELEIHKAQYYYAANARKEPLSQDHKG